MLKRNLIFLFCVILFLTSFVNAGDLPQWGGDVARTRSITETSFNDTLTKLWEYNTEGPVLSSPAISDGYVLFGSRDGNLYSVNLRSGVTEWSFNTDDLVDASPLVDNGYVYFSGRNGFIYCLDLVDGSVIWETFTGGHNLSSPIINNGYIYVCPGFPQNELVALDASSGEIVWEFFFDQISYSSPAFYNGIIYVASNDGKLYAIDSLTGAEVWSAVTGGRVLFSSPTVYNGNVYFLGGGEDLNLYCFDGATGIPAWTQNIGNPSKTLLKKNYNVSKRIINHQTRLNGEYLESKPQGTLSKPTGGGGGKLFAPADWTDVYCSSLAVSNYGVFFIMGFPDQAMYCVDEETGSIVWSDETIGNSSEYPLNATPLIAGNYVYVCTADGKSLNVYDAGSGSKLNSVVFDESIVSSPGIGNGVIVVGDSSGKITAFSSGNLMPNPPDTNITPSFDENVTDNPIIISWDEATDEDDNSASLKYYVRIDDDGEILQDWDYEYETNFDETSIQLSGITDGTYLTYAIRTIDDDGAYSEWSDLYSFYFNKSSVSVPAAPKDFLAIPGNTEVYIKWSPPENEDDIMGYYLVVMDGDVMLWGQPLYLGNVDSYTIDGLTNFKTYTFTIWGVDFGGNYGEEVEAVGVPMPQISIGNTEFLTLEDAIDASTGGDTIIVAPGKYQLSKSLRLPEGVSLTGFLAYTTLSSAGLQKSKWSGEYINDLYKTGTPVAFAIIDGTGLENTIYVVKSGTGEPATIEGVVIKGGNRGVNVSTATVEIRNCVITETITDAVYVGPTSGAYVVNNTIVNNTGNGINNDNAYSVVKNNIVINNDGIGLYNSSGTFTNSYNNVYNNAGGDYVNVDEGEGDISFGVTFLNETDLDFRVDEGQPTIDAGDVYSDYSNEPLPNGKRINMGAFGNTIYAVVSSDLAGSDTPGDTTGDTTGNDTTTTDIDNTTDNTNQVIDIVIGDNNGGNTTAEGPDEMITNDDELTVTKKSGNDSRCFIATAVSGQDLKSMEFLDNLRIFRDEYLLPNDLGNSFVRTYYKLSPPFAEYLRIHPEMKALVKKLMGQ